MSPLPEMLPRRASSAQTFYSADSKRGNPKKGGGGKMSSGVIKAARSANTLDERKGRSSSKKINHTAEQLVRVRLGPV